MFLEDESDNIVQVGWEGKNVGRPVRKLLCLSLMEVTRAWTKMVGGNQNDISFFFLFLLPFLLVELLCIHISRKMTLSLAQGYILIGLSQS